jgi:secondary thiamine-phosphate synthase enzyme
LYQQSIQVHTRHRGTYEITTEVAAIVKSSGIDVGLCNIYIKHTSASLIICENADPSVRTDLENYLSRAVPDGDRAYEHTAEGPDDMPAHIRSILTQVSLTVPVSQGRLAMGIWQGIYVYEHRITANGRLLVVTIQS